MLRPKRVQSFRQSLSWLRLSRERFRGDVKAGCETALAAPAGGGRGGGGGACNPGFRVWFDQSGASSLLWRSTVGTLDSRLRSSKFFTSREFFSTLVEGERKSDDENGREESRGFRRESEQAETVRRFENLLQKWSSNTPLLLNDLQVQLTPVLVCQVVKIIPKSATVRQFFKWASTQPGYHHDVYTYTAVLDHYGRHKNFDAMDQVVSEMKEVGIAPSLVTFTSLMYWHSQVTKVRRVRLVWQQMEEAGCKPNEYIYTSYLDSLVKNDFDEEAMMVFQVMQDSGFRPNVYTFTVMLQSLVKTLQLEAACELYERMKKLQLSPSFATYSILVKAYLNGPNIDKAIYFYKEIENVGLKPSKSLRSQLSAALTSAGRIAEAEELTQIRAPVAMENLEKVALKAVLSGSLPRPERMAELLRDWGPETDLYLERVKLHLRHPYLLNVLSLLRDDPEVTWRYFEWVRAQKSYNPTSHFFDRVLDIIGKTGHAALQKEIFSEAGIPLPGNPVTYATVIQSYCTSKHTDAALLVFHRMKEQGQQPDTNIYTLLIDVLAKTRGHAPAMEMYAEMLKAECKPTVHTYTVILHSLTRSGRVKAALTLFEKLPSFGAPPRVGTYATLLRACLRANELETVLKLYASMRSAGITPSRATHRLVTRGLHEAGMHDEADALSEVKLYFNDPVTGVVQQRIPKPRKRVDRKLSTFRCPSSSDKDKFTAFR